MFKHVYSVIMNTSHVYMYNNYIQTHVCSTIFISVFTGGRGSRGSGNSMKIPFGAGFFGSDFTDGFSSFGGSDASYVHIVLIDSIVLSSIHFSN